MKTFLSSKRFKFILFIAFLAFCWLTGWFLKIDQDSVKDYLGHFPLALSGVIFVVLYVGVTFSMWAAKDLFKLVGALLYGAPLSAFLIWIAESLNAALLFLLARSMGRGFVEKRMGTRYARLDERIESLSFGDLLFLRAVILIPFRFQDLAAGLTRMDLKRYLSAVLLGSPLRIFVVQFFLVVFMASFGKDIMKTAEYLAAHRGIFFFSMAYALATVLLVVRLKRKLSTPLKQGREASNQG